MRRRALRSLSQGIQDRIHGGIHGGIDFFNSYLYDTLLKKIYPGTFGFLVLDEAIKIIGSSYI
jgi:hypothetical protein